MWAIKIGELTITVQSRSRVRDIVVVGLLSSLPAFTAIKIGGIQPTDFVLLALSGLLLGKFLCGGFKLHVSQDLINLARKYALFLTAILCFAILSFRLQFFPLTDVSLLKTPLLFSASRFVQFASVVCGFLWLTNLFLQKPDRLKQALSLYWWVGVCICLFAVLSWALLITIGLDLGGAYDSGETVRVRGFFNEGGPFGLYIASVTIIGFLRRYLTGKRIGFVNLGICGAAFLLSNSRAAFCLSAILLLGSVFAAASFRKRVMSLVLVAGFLWIAAIAMNLPAVLAGYLDSYQNLEDKAASMSEIDPNLVMGRVAGAYIVPRMVEAHPVTGIGIGNYSLMRNDPRYLGSLPPVTSAEDLPGLGLLGDTAEFGIPLTLFIAFLLLLPYFSYRRKAFIVGMAASFQIVAHLMGAHLNFFYPWFVSACAIAVGNSQGERPRLWQASLISPRATIPG